MNGPQAVSITEAATALSCSRSTIYRLLDAGHLRRVKVGRLSRIPTAELDAFLHGAPEGGARHVPAVETR
jgi:excisionase family DNA binding protein